MSYTEKEEKEILAEIIPTFNIEHWYDLLQEAKVYFKDITKRYRFNIDNLNKIEKYFLLRNQLPQLFES